METITMYKATDGELFSTAAECEKHEQQIAEREALYEQRRKNELEYAKTRTAANVLAEVEKLMPQYNNGGLWSSSYSMERVSKQLSIFDWFVYELSQTRLKEMRSFLKTAIKLGYTGYVCFKVGATGCANGMWAYKALSENGYSPDGECLYRSFTPAYTSWDAQLKDGTWAHDIYINEHKEDGEAHSHNFSLAEVKKYIEQYNA